METIEKQNKLNVSPQSIFEKAMQMEYSVCMYKLTGSKYIHILIDDDFSIPEYPLELDSMRGFVFAPFETDKNKPVILIKDKCSYLFEVSETGAILPINSTGTDVLAFDEGLNEPKQEKVIEHKREYAIAGQSETEFTTIVRKCIGLIKSKGVRKIVLSRSKEVGLSQDFLPADFFIKLVHTYNDSFISLVSNPVAGTWIGATPELLMSINRNNIFKTVALAGTQVKSKDSDNSQTLWTQKEIEEQALVNRYIISCFKKIRLREYDEIGPKTVQAGNLLHLKTEFLVNMDEVNFENLGSVMLQLLHPTSAVCGMPKEEALQFIKANETTPRAYYSGFLGPVNLSSDSEPGCEEIQVFVNIRCMQLFENKAVSYAGAGITEDSMPEREFAETENKMNTLLKVLKGN